MVRVFADRLPIDDILPELDAALTAGPNLVLVAPPGAGKTTRVPLAQSLAAMRGESVVEASILACFSCHGADAKGAGRHPAARRPAL